MFLKKESFEKMIEGKAIKFEEYFPSLIEKLVEKVISKEAYIRFLTGDDNRLPGWDGIVDNNKNEHKYIPAGNLRFEIGTGKKAIQKIKTDYKTRRDSNNIENKSDLVYIAITSHCLNNTKKEKLINEFNKEKVYKKFLILDLIDIVKWMNDYLDICLEFLEEFDRETYTSGISSIKQEWEKISFYKNYRLSEKLFLAGNDSCKEELLKKLKYFINNGQKKNENILYIVSEEYGIEFAFNFFIATAILFENNRNIIVVSKKEAYDTIKKHLKNVVVLINFNCDPNLVENDRENYYIFLKNKKMINRNNIILEFTDEKIFTEELYKNLGISKEECYKLASRFFYNSAILKKDGSLANEKEAILLSPIALLNNIEDNETAESFKMLQKMINFNTKKYFDDLSLIVDNPFIIKLENVYKVGAREELFKYLNWTVDSGLLLRLEKALIYKYKNIEKEQTKVWSHQVLMYSEIEKNILDGFIIMAKNNEKYIKEFEELTFRIFESAKKEIKKFLFILNNLPKLAELSPENTLSFIEDVLKKNKNELFLKENESHINEKISSIVKTFEIIFIKVNKLHAKKSFKIFIDLYFEFPDSYILKEILYYLSWSSTYYGQINLNLNEKTKIFLNSLNENNLELGSEIIEYLLLEKELNFSPKNFSNFEHTELKNNIIHVSLEERIKTGKDLFSFWINNINNSKSNLGKISTILLKICSKDMMFSLKDINEFFKLAKAKLQNKDIITKAYIFKMLKSDDNYSSFHNENKDKIKILKNFEKFLVESGNYFIYRDAVITDCYSLSINTNPLEYNEYILKNIKQKEKIIKKLIKTYGEEILLTLLEETEYGNYLHLKIIYKYAKEPISHLKVLIKKHKENVIKNYLENFSDENLIKVFHKFSDEKQIIMNLPLKKVIFTKIIGNEFEEDYWKNQKTIRFNGQKKYLIKKFIEFAPLNLLYYFDSINNKEKIEVLKRIVILVKNNKLYYDDLKNVVIYIYNWDKKHISADFSKIIFELINYLEFKTTNAEYPKNLKEYFWKNPDKFSKYLIDEKLALNPKSIGGNILSQINSYCRNYSIIEPHKWVSKEEKIEDWIKIFLNDFDKILDEKITKKIN
ncbi:hypothetical protein [Mycoplasma struthionis]|uniref:Uncharacterized protein n=1 Tax=Mycoplasma struthionis TaxID=538220 RepID=A0A502M5H4_9MOLU|nr:hypothetical protein [Mycoplasma struthionis]TPI01174.1 hypothetical protein FJM01_03105 [Mycoplasma struthionis]